MDLQEKAAVVMITYALKDAKAVLSKPIRGVAG